MGIEVGGIFGLLILIANIYAIIKVVQSGAGTGSKVLWVVLILVLPIMGLILWFLFGPKSASGESRV
ncbi:MAG: PLDc N-terminal domain-containing protein [Desulfocapsaceae bacterium]|nr:PLDc N-terminal domain-containing protein [Desulfocapsaceae bacterium]